MSDERDELEDELFVPTDEPEQITAEEALETSIPLPEEATEEEAHLASTVCDVCLELNLTTASIIKCARCEQAFCYHFTSALDAQYCTNCMSDVSVTKSNITKAYEHVNPETGARTYYRRRAREIKIEGLSWLFAQRKIAELSDVELDMAIEYHRNIYSLMMDEAERRRNERMHRYANSTFKIPTPSTTKVSDNTQTTVKKTRTVTKTKAGENIAALLQSMLAKGMSMDQILAAVQKGGKK